MIDAYCMFKKKYLKYGAMILSGLALLYLILLIPEGSQTATDAAPSKRQAFAWNQDTY